MMIYRTSAPPNQLFSELTGVIFEGPFRKKIKALKAVAEYNGVVLEYNTHGFLWTTKVYWSMNGTQKQINSATNHLIGLGAVYSP